MVVHDLDEAQDALEPKDDLAPYVGRWVALRNGKVIASDMDPLRMRGRLAATEYDVTFPVPRSHYGIYIP